MVRRESDIVRYLWTLTSTLDEIKTENQVSEVSPLKVLVEEIKVQKRGEAAAQLGQKRAVCMHCFSIIEESGSEESTTLEENLRTHRGFCKSKKYLCSTCGAIDSRGKMVHL